MSVQQKNAKSEDKEDFSILMVGTYFSDEKSGHLNLGQKQRMAVDMTNWGVSFEYTLYAQNCNFRDNVVTYNSIR